MFLDPSDDLLDDFLELVVDGERIGKRPYGCPLFNVQINDGHFSALGSQSWARTVGRRLELLLDRTDSLDDMMRTSEGLLRDKASSGQTKTPIEPNQNGATKPALAGEER